MKKRITIYVDEKTYKDFQLQSLIIDKNVSQRIEEFMREQIKIYNENNK